MNTARIDISKKELLAFVRDGWTDSQIADLLHVSESTVSSRRREYGIGRYVKIYDRIQYLRMKDVELTDEQVCYIWSCSRRDLNRWKSRMGLSKKRDKGA